MKKTFISCPYVYPIYPLNVNHARMFVIADIIARYSRKKGGNVFFPIASHYSGNSAEYISNIFTKIFSKNSLDTKEKKRVFGLYKNTYKVPSAILKNFVTPLNILNFFYQETIWELKLLNVSADYKHSYTTEHKDFSIFVNTIISLYKKGGLLAYNKNKKLALNYDNNKWRKKVLNLLNKTEFIQPFHKNNILSAMRHIRSDWGLLRKNGFGVKYKTKWIIGTAPQTCDSLERVLSIN